MVCRRVVVRAFTATAGIVLVATFALSCGNEREMSESLEMIDTTEVMRAMQDKARRDPLLDTMPGGEMARGDSTAEMRRLKAKMER